MTGSRMQELTEFTSGAPFDATVDRLIKTIARSGMRLFARIDHAAGALGVGMPMPPSTVLIYGNPAGGTPLMLSAPRAALDLPLRVLVHENPQGDVSILFHPMAPVLRQAGVPEALANRLDRAQLMLVEALS